MVTAAVLWEILQIVGGYYIGHVYRHSSNTYAQFALVIALMVWLHLGAQVTLYAAEINVVLNRKLWPRRLLDGPRSRPTSERYVRWPRSKSALPASRWTSTSGRRTRVTQNNLSGLSRRVIAGGHEHRPPSAGQPWHNSRCG